MGTHPNAMLICIFTPDDLARKTYRDILRHVGFDGDNSSQIKIGDAEYHHQVMEGDYDEGQQIAAPEGSIVFHDLFTYGYGEKKRWVDLERQQHVLEEWAATIDVLFNCKHEIFVGANYW